MMTTSREALTVGEAEGAFVVGKLVGAREGAGVGVRVMGASSHRQSS
jgi:hypothetical protein